MPISRKDFEEENFIIMKGAATKILEFFKKNKDKAFTSQEISDALGKKRPGVTPLLKRLKEAHLIDFKYPYYCAAKQQPTEAEQKKKLIEIEKNRGKTIKQLRQEQVLRASEPKPEPAPKPEPLIPKEEPIPEEEDFEPYEGEPAEGEEEPYEEKER